MATLWGAKVVVMKVIPDDEVVAVSSWKGSMRKGADVIVRRKLVFSGSPKVVPEEDRMKAMEELLLKVAKKVGV
jgi:hypothetical protein